MKVPIVPGTTPWVCLVYHNVAVEIQAIGGGPSRFSVPLRMFERMLDVIRNEGLLGCSLATAIAERGRRRVAITFDDAEAGVFDNAIPALRARGMSATVYVVTEWVGRPGFMTWDQLRQSVDWGISVQSHTRSHAFLSELNEDQLRVELAEPKATLDRELGQDTNELAFPGGDPPRRSLRHLIADAGYCVSVGTRWGRNPDDFDASAAHVRRCTVRGDTSREEAVRIVRGDHRLALERQSRELLLRSVRSFLGSSRYARWRRRVLDTVSPPKRP